MSGKTRQGAGRKVYLVAQARGADRWEAQTEALPCRVTTLRGGEEVIAGRLRGVNTSVIRVRAAAVPGVTPSWRLKDQVTGEVYAISSLILSRCGRWLDCTCQSGVPT